MPLSKEERRRIEEEEAYREQARRRICASGEPPLANPVAERMAARLEVPNEDKSSAWWLIPAAVIVVGLGFWLVPSLVEEYRCKQLADRYAAQMKEMPLPMLLDRIADVKVDAAAHYSRRRGQCFIRTRASKGLGAFTELRSITTGVLAQMIATTIGDIGVCQIGGVTKNCQEVDAFILDRMTNPTTGN